MPAEVIQALRDHLASYGNDPDALVFTGAKGGRLTPANWRRAVGWTDALRSVGLPAGFHFHDLRHTSNDLAAASGASTRELMHRMGHSTLRAALIY
jgi:integrase